MSVKKIEIFGLASNRIIKTLIPSEDGLQIQNSLMTYLQSEGIPIASSCSGDGVCKKCMVTFGQEKQQLSCQITLKEYLNNKDFDKIITINYL